MVGMNVYRHPSTNINPLLSVKQMVFIFRNSTFYPVVCSGESHSRQGAPVFPEPVQGSDDDSHREA